MVLSASASVSNINQDGLKADPAAPIVFCRRADLQISRQDYEGSPCFVVKDPLSLTYFRFRPVEIGILERLNGHRSLLEIQEALVADGIDRDSVPDAASIEAFVLRLAAEGLIVSASIGRGKTLLHQQRQMAARQSGWSFAKLLYLKFPGIDPSPLLDRLLPLARPLFTPFAMLVAGILVFVSTVIAVVEAERILSGVEQQAFEAFFTPGNIIVLWLVLGLTKVCHELGHALTCRHFGGECHDMGFLLLVFSPALYCNTSDAWTLSNKWHRIAISGAGIVVELVIASIATLVWYSTSPGLLHNVAFSTMFICSVSTLLINGNPLMRYDGYYILCDLLQIPNLRQRAAFVLQRMIGQTVFGMKTSSGNSLPAQHRLLFCCYAIGATVYRWLVCGLILWFLYNVLRPYGLGSISLLLAAAAAVSLIVQPLYSFLRLAIHCLHAAVGLPRVRAAVGMLLLLAVPATLLLLPLPVSVVGSLTLGGQQRFPIVMESSGRLKSVYVKSGQLIKEGELLAEFENPQLEDQILQLQAEVDQLAVRAEKHWATGNTAERHAAGELLATRQKQLHKLQQLAAGLKIRAPTAGRLVLSPRTIPWSSDAAPSSPLSRSEGHILEQRQSGSYVIAGTQLGEICPEEIRHVELLVEQNRLNDISRGQPVKVCLDAWPGRRLTGTVDSVAVCRADEVPEQLATNRGGELVASADPNGRQLLLKTYYQIGVRLSADDCAYHSFTSHLVGMRGRGRIACGQRSGHQVLMRLICDAFFL